ncbi:MAG TPA: energy transducer TonB [Lysobacter sp.]|nr:energy transducer TonB [Lysobacter sp.]
MRFENQSRRVRRVSYTTHALAALTVALALAGCGKDQPDAQQAADPAAGTTTAVTPANAVSAKVAAMTPEQLAEAARKAYAENRLYAPAGDNAVEYYLALRDKQPNDPSVASALTDLLPMTVIAVEQSVAREDFAEAQRLTALLEKADAQHPALARLKSSITAAQTAAAQRAEQEKLTAEEEAKRQQEIERQRLAQQQQQQQLAAQQLAAQQAAERQAAEQRAAEQRAAEQRAAEQRAAEQRAAETRPAQQTAAPTATASASDLRALSTPAPRYPPEALRAGQSGEVLVEFTVAPDGSVSAARVVRSTPPRIFDREAINAVRRWRFQPVGSQVTTRRTITFNPGG